MVKLKEAKQYLRDFFFVKDGVPAYQENDIMMAVSYLNGVANILNRPLVICVALGNSAGSHASEGFLPSYLNYICGRRKRVVVTAAGNEANARHHFQGRIIGEMEHEDAEITVELLHGHTAGWDEAAASFDGDTCVKLGIGDCIRIYRSSRMTRLIKINNISFLEVLRNKMNDQ